METPSVAIPGYRLLAVLGKGAMATVYRAEHERLGKQVALKVLDNAIARDPDYRERFLREARAAAKLNHANIVRALDAGVENGAHFFAMELVEGEDLRQRIERDGPLAEKKALEIARAVAQALDEASRHGIVHRDVKPENILLARTGEVKLADLGLAKSQEDASLTKEGFTLGTVAFFSPEQARGDPSIDVRTDFYSLGATIYVALTGELPFGRGVNGPETMRRIIQEGPRPIRELAPRTSRATVRLVERFMEKDRADRPSTPAEAIALLDATLAAIASGHADDPGPDGERAAPARKKRGPRGEPAPATPSGPGAWWRRSAALAAAIALASFLLGTFAGRIAYKHVRAAAAQKDERPPGGGR